MPRFIISYFKISVVSVLLFLSSLSIHANQDDTSSISIEHYRAFAPPLTTLSSETNIITNVTQSKDNFLWVTGNRDTLFRYDSYELKALMLQTLPSKNKH